jgi:hypothetical protein
MKAGTNPKPDLVPRGEGAILDQIRDDHELIARLHITPQEIEALSKCALLGTLTCKQDMLFILRQIREASSPGIDHTTLFPTPPERNALEEAPDRRNGAHRAAPIMIPEPGSLDRLNRRRLPEQFGVIFWAVVLVAGLVWNAVRLMPRIQEKFSAIIGAPGSEAPVSDGWYSRLDHANVLLFWEVLLVVAIAIAIQLKSRHSSRRFKVRPRK